MDQRGIVIEFNSEESEELLCFKRSERNKNEYAADDGSVVLKVEQDADSGGRIYRIESCTEEYRMYQNDILGLFEARYEEVLQAQREDYESGFEIIEEEDDTGIKVPYDPKLITVAPAKFSLKEIVGMIDGEEDEEPVLDLAPDFQRDYVWDNVRKSRLIESILLNIPLPVFYFARDKDGKMQVVDGVQRLTTIHKYFKNEFRLTKLEYLKEECEGKYFKKQDLPEEKNLRPRLVRALRQYQIDCNIIEPSTPENVKLDIFKRLNTGGKELNKQEVRHAFMKKEVRAVVKKLVNTREFLQATDYSISDKRMMAQELILRYIGFYCLYIDNFLQVEYSTKMDEFLDDVAVKLNLCKKIPASDIESCFTRAMKNACKMFGKKAFRKLDFAEDGEVTDKRNPINKSLFIALAVVLSSYPVKEISKRGNVCREFAEYMNQDEGFYYSISHNTNYQIRETAIGKVRVFLEKIYGAREEKQE